METEQTGGPILDQEEIKTIFSKIPEIYEVHHRLLEDVETLLEDYNDEKSIAQIILKHVRYNVHVYPYSMVPMQTKIQLLLSQEQAILILSTPFPISTHN